MSGSRPPRKPRGRCPLCATFREEVACANCVNSRWQLARERAELLRAHRDAQEERLRAALAVSVALRWSNWFTITTSARTVLVPISTGSIHDATGSTCMQETLQGRVDTSAAVMTAILVAWLAPECEPHCTMFKDGPLVGCRRGPEGKGRAWRLEGPRLCNALWLAGRRLLTGLPR